MKKNAKIEFIIGAVLLVALLVLGATYLGGGMLMFRMIVGLTLGYTLMRSCFGFAGGVNRAYNTGSTKLMRTLMVMFFASAVLTAGILYASQDAASYDLWVNQINLGLIVGGLLFGLGMACSMCCASGVLTDITDGPARAIITLIFFGAGVFVGFPIQNSAGWVQNTLFSTETFANGVYLPDWFKWDGMDGYLGAVILTGILCAVVIAISKAYENNRKRNGTYTGVDSEIAQDETAKSELNETKPVNVVSTSTFEKVFIKPWSLARGATVITAVFTLLMLVTKSGWGASSPYGFWFGRVLNKFGVSASSIAEFTKGGEGPYTVPFFENAMNVQNVSIVLGALIALLFAGRFVTSFKSGLKITLKDSFVYMAGGFLMGFGTRLSNGCNVGALYTPIANFSLSGWIFFVVLVAGAIGGNMIKKKIYAND